MKKRLITGLALLFLGAGAMAQDSTAMSTTDGKIGKMSVETFQSNNAKGAQMVAAITPTRKALSASDKALMMQVAAGGQTQLALSQAALDKVTSPEAKLLAQSEVEEQTGVAAKLKEIADAKGITLPDGPDEKAQAAVTKLQAMDGDAADAFYVSESGVKGHVKLRTTMTTVSSKAVDPALKKLAMVTLPVIKMHLAVSTDVRNSMAGNGASKAGTK